MTAALVIFLILVGAAGGSFVGAMTWRMKKRLDWVRGRSICEHCKHQLSGLDLVPIVSWLALGGKCRYCHKKIGWLAFGLEIGVAAAFVASYFFWPMGEIIVNNGLNLVQFTLFGLWLVNVVLMAALLVYDARWGFLPNKLMWPLVGAAAMFAVLNNVLVQHLAPIDFLVQIGLAMLPVAGVYLVVYLIGEKLLKKSLIGFGDVRFGLVVGLLVNWVGAVLVLFGANLLGTLAMIPLLVTRRKTMDSKVPFGPFLIAATFLTFLFLPDLVDLVENYLVLL